MVRDIVDGHLQVTERSFRRLDRAEIHKLGFELEKQLREIRSDQPPLDDIPALQHRNRRIQRLNATLMMLRAFRQKQRF